MKKYKIKLLKQAHQASIYHEAKILGSKLCGCFYCLETFPPQAILAWVDENSPQGRTAICPHCDIDSVLGDEFPIGDKDFLDQMHQHWFAPT